MRKLTRTAVVVVALSCLGTLAQGPPTLDTFTSPDGNFQFVYPESYELLVGERILRATQGRQSTLPVCDFSTAVACVIYPLESERETRLEAAGFTVATVAGANESDCLSYKDDKARSRTLDLSSTSISIRSRPFRHASGTKKIPGHMQSSDFYRTFTRQKCYELQIQVSISEDSATQKVSVPNSLGDATAHSARESLKLILSSVVFENE
ncbi:MAG TPA: hypothetical protein VMS18_20505 [Candidatus Binatia bacterium]|nr:hypothetical protein [Candidatus Binatia bacterium]